MIFQISTRLISVHTTRCPRGWGGGIPRYKRKVGDGGGYWWRKWGLVWRGLRGSPLGVALNKGKPFTTLEKKLPQDVEIFFAQVGPSLISLRQGAGRGRIAKETSSGWREIVGLLISAVLCTRGDLPFSNGLFVRTFVYACDCVHVGSICWHVHVKGLELVCVDRLEGLWRN